jgi:HPr kinase/phosphorylase
VTLTITADRVHGSAVGFDIAGRALGVLMLGGSGSGKSELALQLMAIGAVLVADDQTLLRRSGAEVVLRAPPTIRGLIEMRGMGLLHAATMDCAILVAVINLDAQETQRLPERATANVLGVQVPYLRDCASAAFPAAIKQYLLSCVIRKGQGMQS